MRTANPSYITKRPGDAEWTFTARVDGRRFAQKVPAHLTARSDAAKWARARVKEMRAESSCAMAEEYLRNIQRKRTGCTVGDICARVMAALLAGEMTRKTGTDMRRLVNSLRLVLAHARDLWVRHDGGVRGVKIGDEIPDVARIDALPATVLDADTVRRYFQSALGVPAVNRMVVYESAASVNSILNHARGVFRGETKELLHGLALPDMTGFLKRSLKTSGDLPEPVEAEAFGRMVELFDGLKDMRRDLWLLNTVFRQTGMRAGSVLAFEVSWLRRLADGWWLDIRPGAGVKTCYSLPLADDLAAELMNGGRFTKALLDEHTGLLKGIIGAGAGGQVNHRLRDTVASACYHWLGLVAAQEALGHADAKTTLKHYARRMDVSDLMRREMRAWERILPAPHKVVAMQEAA